MSATPDLWNLSIQIPPSLAPLIEEIWSEETLATTLSTQESKGLVQIDLIFKDPPNLEEIESKLAIVALMQNEAEPSFTLTEVGHIDWLQKVATPSPLLKIAHWQVHSPEHRAETINRRNALEIQAASAFGTGAHPTTRGCLLMLDRLLRQKNTRLLRLLDMGCGSGLLSLAFVQATKGSAVAIDLDPASVRLAKTNAKTNGLARFSQIALGNGYRSPLTQKSAPYDLVMANIFAGPLCQMAKGLAKVLRPKGWVILAGLLSRHANKVLAAHRAQGITLRRRLVIGEWTILLLQKG